MATEGVTREVLEEGQLWRVRLATPKANILDRAKISALSQLYADASREPHLKAIVLDGEGPNFSFGASVEEHLPGQFEEMIPAFHQLAVAILEAPVPTLAAVRGQCLGGGLEVALTATRIFAAADAKLGQPEILLGVFAPVASILLLERVGRGAAEHLCLTGQSVDATEALRVGLVDEVCEDPGAAAAGYAREYLLPLSASSLHLAVRAVRGELARRFRERILETERLYVDDLMPTRDAVEGLGAFLEKRAPKWEDR